MPSIHEFDVYVFDCDGVIFDSNELKINAMESALTALSFNRYQIEHCIDYFSKNFGKSRFHHVDLFFSEYLSYSGNVDVLKTKLLNNFSMCCQTLYQTAEITPGFIEFIESLDGSKYVASGSAQDELREVFKKRGIYKYFKDVLGSPTPKQKLLSDILSIERNKKVVMIGDAISDLEAAEQNNCQFIAYTPYSNVKTELAERVSKLGFGVVNSWRDIR